MDIGVNPFADIETTLDAQTELPLIETSASESSFDAVTDRPVLDVEPAADTLPSLDAGFDARTEAPSLDVTDASAVDEFDVLAEPSDRDASGDPPTTDASDAASPADAGPPARHCGASAQVARCSVLSSEGTATAAVRAPDDAVDVLLLVDDTASMDYAIAELRATLSAGLIPGIRARFTDAAIGLASFRDFPVVDVSTSTGYGILGDRPFYLRARIGADARSLEDASRLEAMTGGDPPESATEALYQSLTTDGIPGLVEPTRDCAAGPPCVCPAGTLGAVCFRPNAAHLVVLITDTASHNGPLGRNDYAREAFERVEPPYLPHTWAQTRAVLRASRARVLGVQWGDNEFARADLEAYAGETGAVSREGTPLVFDRPLYAPGPTITERVLEALRLFRGERYRTITARVVDCATDALLDEVLRGVRVASVTPAGPETRIDGATVFDAPLGAMITFAFNFDVARLPDRAGRLVRVEIVGDDTQILGTYELDVYGAGSVPVGCR